LPFPSRPYGKRARGEASPANLSWPPSRRRAPTAPDLPPNGTAGECGQYCGGRMGSLGSPWLLQRCGWLAMFPPSCSGRDLLEELEMPASNNPRRAARDRPIGIVLGGAGPVAAASGADESARASRCGRGRRRVAPGHGTWSDRIFETALHGWRAAWRGLSAGTGARAGSVRLLLLPAAASSSLGRASCGAPQAEARCRPRRAVASRSRGGASEEPPGGTLPCGRTRLGSRCRTAPPARCRSPARRSASAGIRTTTSACPIRPSIAITR
jgi:hypothetical protein